MALPVTSAATLLCLAFAPIVSSTSTTCINITLNNVLDIGDCLGTNTDYCTTTTPVTKFLTKLITCPLQGILKYGSTEGILWALSGLGQILLNSLGIGNVVTNVPASGHWVATSQTCKDPIRLTTADIGLLGKCVANFADLCPAGTVAQDTVFEKLFDTLKQDLVTIALGQICSLAQLFQKVNVGIDILTFLDRFLSSVVAGITC
ncbi:hypothetical protein V5799_024402 [Amblyomma americanum]|uniref:Secreted protein n=1 Tax=Amblyomma americanum TaxID=6943 RepID=A0AAQ4ECF2_AMBAM